jgi:hypothetical protein
MKFVIRFILIFLLVAPFSYARSDDTSRDAKDEEDLNGNEQPPQTANLSASNNLWAQTSPVGQVVLGVVDLVFVGYAQSFQDPEFKEASRKYTIQHRKEKKIKSEAAVAHQEMVNEEKALQQLNVERDNLEKDLRIQQEQIKIRTNELEKARKILTTGEKETHIISIKSRLVDLHTRAILEHQGKVSAEEDIFNSLSSSEQGELAALRQDYNSTREMPDVNREQKAALIKDADGALKQAQETRDHSLKSMRDYSQKISAQVQEIEKLRPRVAELDASVKTETETSDVLNRELTRIGKQKGLRRMGYAIVRWGGTTLFGLDFGFRIIYYYAAQQDPGWFPFGRVLQKFF